MSSLKIPTQDEMVTRNLAKPEDFTTHKSTKVVGNLHGMKHEKDPKAEITNQVGDLEDIEIGLAQVLVATYERPEKTSGGIILTQNTREEDRYQGKCGLVLKVGPLAFTETEKIKFGGLIPKVGDWVFYRPLDGYALSVHGKHCRVIDDVDVRGRIKHPDVIL